MNLKFEVTNRAAARNVGWIKGGKWFDKGQTRIVDVSEIVWTRDRASDLAGSATRDFEVAEGWVDVVVLTDQPTRKLVLADISKNAPEKVPAPGLVPGSRTTDDSAQEDTMLSKGSLDDHLPKRVALFSDDDDSPAVVGAEQVSEPRTITKGQSYPGTLEDALPPKKMISGDDMTATPATVDDPMPNMGEPRIVTPVKGEDAVFQQLPAKGNDEFATEVGSDMMKGRSGQLTEKVVKPAQRRKRGVAKDTKSKPKATRGRKKTEVTSA